MAGSEQDEIQLPPSIYFGGCGWGCAFYIGVHKALVEKWGALYYRNMLVCGGSAGAFVALMIVLGNTPDELADLYTTIARNANLRGAISQASQCMVEEIERRVNALGEDAYTKANGRLCISMTTFPSNHVFRDHWISNKELLDCITVSGHIPFYSHGTEILDDRGYIILDGAYGVSGADFIHGNETLFVGIDPAAEIGRELTNREMLYPSVDEAFDGLFDSGYQKALEWDGKMLNKVNLRKPNYPVLIILWTLKLLELLWHAILRVLTILSVPLWSVKAPPIKRKLSGKNLATAMHAQPSTLKSE